MLGEPGAGKSTLVEVLAARLAGSEFLPIRVRLHDVVAESTVLSQIDQGLRTSLGEDVRFEELVEAGQGALPVVLLDGFGELVQAAGEGRHDYLEQIQEFQARQYRVGRPVAVVVTGRTVVADRVRFPDGLVVLQLRPFEEDQVRRWLDIWDQANRAVLARRDRAPLSAGDALAHPELATQPLLLLLLALHDATGDGVRGAGPIGRAQLYEALIRGFARREVARDASAVGLPPPLAARPRRPGAGAARGGRAVDVRPRPSRSPRRPRSTPTWRRCAGRAAGRTGPPGGSSSRAVRPRTVRGTGQTATSSRTPRSASSSSAGWPCSRCASWSGDTT
ncbi:NACHT domain-containing protein [Nonomuraea ferruginea]